jgi:hypothetical protein
MAMGLEKLLVDDGKTKKALAPENQRLRKGNSVERWMQSYRCSP